MLVPDGRRPIYLISLTMSCIGSFGVATTRNVPELLLWRVVQAFGASSGHSVGMGVIGDIYRLEERGAAVGIYFGVRSVLYILLFAHQADTPRSGGYARSSVGPARWRLGRTLVLVAGYAIRPAWLRSSESSSRVFVATRDVSAGNTWIRTCRCGKERKHLMGVAESFRKSRATEEPKCSAPGKRSSSLSVNRCLR